MNIVLEDVWKDSASCNFCQKGELNKRGSSLIYPYEKVVTFNRCKGSGLKASICEECLDELHKNAKIKFGKEK